MVLTKSASLKRSLCDVNIQNKNENSVLIFLLVYRSPSNAYYVGTSAKNLKLRLLHTLSLIFISVYTGNE